MTFTFNGFGTSLCGQRWLNELEYYNITQHDDFNDIVNKLEIKTEEDKFRFMIATKSICIFWLPVIPLETFIYYSPKVKWHQNEKYIPLFYTSGKGKVDWNHVKKSWSFYLGPVVFLILIYLWFFSS